MALQALLNFGIILLLIKTCQFCGPLFLEKCTLQSICFRTESKQLCLYSTFGTFSYASGAPRNALQIYSTHLNQIKSTEYIQKNKQETP